MTSGKEMRPLTSAASPSGWSWSKLDASRPRRAIEHITQTDVTPVTIDRLGPSDALPDSEWRMTREIPVLAVDTLDSFWVFERIINKLHGFSRTKEEAKADLLNKLGGHLQLLSSLESPKMAPILRLELEFLRVILRPTQASGA